MSAARLLCAGCGAEHGPAEPYPFRCPNAGRNDDVDHVLRRQLELSAVQFPAGDTEQNPFVRYRGLLYAYHVATAGGLADADFCGLVRRLDRRVAEVDGHGFGETPFLRSDELSDRLGFSERGGIWVKDETCNVSGSHKARHLFGVLVYLEVAEQLGLTAERPDLAIASCGNAALAAAVVAAAGDRVLQVFVPTDADRSVVARLQELGAHVDICPRDGGEPGDPTYHLLVEALALGALPFTCQGNLNGLAVEGGQTLGYEIASTGVELNRLVVQVGGGALASACVHAFREAVQLGVLAASPRINTVQTAGAWPLRRAYERALRAGVGYPARHRSEFMWPWEQTPRSVAHGILDDETYDWLAVVEGMLATGGTPLVVGEETLCQANALAHDTSDIDVDPTGSAGLAGLLALRGAGEVDDDEQVALLYTGVTRSRPATRRERTDEELSRSRHPVAQAL